MNACFLNEHFQSLILVTNKDQSSFGTCQLHFLMILIYLIVYCPAGEFIILNDDDVPIGCEPCPRGTYKDTPEGENDNYYLLACIQCDADGTLNIGSTAVDQCVYGKVLVCICYIF